MADPLAQQIIEVLRARLATIQVVDGFHTDAGRVVRHGRLKLDTPELHLAIHAGAVTEKEDHGRNRVDAALHVEIAGSVPVPDADTGGRVVELVIADVQRAVEQGRRRHLGDDGTALGQDVTPLGRLRLAPVKETATGKVRNEFFTLTYLVRYHRIYGSPDRRV